MANNNFKIQRQDYSRNESLSITTTSREVAQNMSGKGGRRNIILRNNSPNAADIITISRGRNAAVAGSGIVLNQGEVWYDSTDVTSVCWQYEIQAVCATANGILAVSEE